MSLVLTVKNPKIFSLIPKITKKSRKIFNFQKLEPEKDGILFFKSKHYNSMCNHILNSTLKALIDRARPAGGINTQSYDLETFTDGRRSQRLFWGSIFTPPDCSSNPQRWPPLLGVYVLQWNRRKRNQSLWWVLVSLRSWYTNTPLNNIHCWRKSV